MRHAFERPHPLHQACVFESKHHRGFRMRHDPLLGTRGRRSHQPPYELAQFLLQLGGWQVD